MHLVITGYCHTLASSTLYLQPVITTTRFAVRVAILAFAGRYHTARVRPILF